MCHHHTWLRAGPGNELLKCFRSVSDVCLFNKSRTHKCKWQLSLGNFGAGRGGGEGEGSRVRDHITLSSRTPLLYLSWDGDAHPRTSYLFLTGSQVGFQDKVWSQEDLLNGWLGQSTWKGQQEPLHLVLWPWPLLPQYSTVMYLHLPPSPCSLTSGRKPNCLSTPSPLSSGPCSGICGKWSFNMSLWKESTEEPLLTDSPDVYNGA